MPKIIHHIARALFRCYPFPRGSRRIIDRTFLGRIGFQEETLRVQTTDGFAMRVDPNDHIGRHIFLSGQFDRTIAELLLKFSRPGDCILDIGANIGYVSCVLLARIPDFRVVAAEPQPHCFERLSETLDEFESGRRLAIQAAVSDHTGAGHLLIYPENNGQSQLVACPENNHNSLDGECIKVRLLTATSLIEEASVGRIDLIKIDVEGHELRVLSSLDPVIRKHRPRSIVFESHGGSACPNKPVGRLFSQLNYRIQGVVKHLTRLEFVDVDISTTHRFNGCVALPN
jgi:FkbM family methyltransferase